MPVRVQIFEKATGEPVERFSIDANECVASGFYVRTLAEVVKAPEPGEVPPVQVSEATEAKGADVVLSTAPEAVKLPEVEKTLNAWSLLMAAAKGATVIGSDGEKSVAMADFSIIQNRMKELYIGNDVEPDAATVLDGLPYTVPETFNAAVPEIVAKLREAAK